MVLCESLALLVLFTLGAAVAIADKEQANSDKSATAPSSAIAALRIVKQECLSCHNPEKHKGGLLLLNRDQALKGGENGPALVPGKSAESAMIKALDADADPHMPPKKQLAAESIATLRAWIDAGAPWDEKLMAEASIEPAMPPVTLRQLPKTYRPVLTIALSPDDKRLAVGRGNQVLLHDLTDKARPITRVLDGARDAIQSLAWSPDGKRLAAGDYGRVLIWEIGDKPADVDTSRPTEIAGVTGRVTALLFMPDNKTLLAADGGVATPGRLHVFHLASERSGKDVEASDKATDRLTPAQSIDAHGDEILAIARDKQGKLLATAGGDKVVKLWDADTLKELGKLEGHTGRVSAVTFSPDGSVVASAGADRDLKVWDVKTRERKQNVGPHPAPITGITWVGEKQIAVVCEDGSLRLDKSDATDLGRAFSGSADDVLYSVAATTDGKLFFGGAHDGQVYAWNATGKLEGKLPAATK